jgi:hypothetical protein
MSEVADSFAANCSTNVRQRILKGVSNAIIAGAWPQ